MPYIFKCSECGWKGILEVTSLEGEELEPENCIHCIKKIEKYELEEVK